MTTAKLSIISTPIGNIGDLSTRAREAMERIDYFLAEDTREFIKLLGLVGIELAGKTVKSFHEHNREAVRAVLERLDAGLEVAIVSDAGSPVLSDPAYPLVDEVLKAGFEIDTLPGATSVIAALELSGLAPMPFSFVGFLPREREKQKSLIASWTAMGTVVCFESPHRVERTLDEIALDFPELKVAICREITKKFQSVHRFTASEWPTLKTQLTVKGEFVLVLSQGRSRGESGAGASSEKVQELARMVLTKGGPKAVAKLLSEILGEDSKEIYKNLTRSHE